MASFRCLCHGTVPIFLAPLGCAAANMRVGCTNFIKYDRSKHAALRRQVVLNGLSDCVDLPIACI